MEHFEPLIIRSHIFLPIRLPYMNHRQDLPYCKGDAEVTEAFARADSLIYGTWKPDGCTHCVYSCKRLDFEFRSDTIDDRTDYSGRVKVFLADKTYESVQENFSYGFTSLVADFGGTLGLLLGASVLTMLEILEYVCSVLARLLKRLMLGKPITKTCIK
ncbi:Epithelial sodium channel [Trinorchestia longiramus]|nr:Epithelial sodium channel [Trinorchestia longiramus]